jgi:iron complex transport system ATP-binding protein
VVEVRELFCGYNSEPVLQGISFSVNRGEFCGIIGPNGSGKTTLLRAITKVLKPKSGEIYIEGQNINEIDFKKLAQKVAVVSQIQDFGFNMKVEEFVLLGRIPYRQKFQFLETKIDEKFAQKAMELTGIIKFKNRFIQELSGGERQLVVIARALAQTTKLLLLDEPIAHLDITHQVKILDLIRKLNKENEITVIVVLHDLNLASEYCDKLVLLNKGCIHKIGTPKEVLTYQIIEEVYNTIVVVKESPISHKPHVLVVANHYKNINI